MEEKILVKSEQYNIGKICKKIFVFILLGLIAFCIGFFIWHLNDGLQYGISFSAALDDAIYFSGVALLVSLGVGVGAALILYFFYWIMSKEELVVSDKRVYGRVAFGRRVDLPIDSVSAVGMSIFKSIAIGTSSGRIYFNGVKNRDEIHKCISDLLLDRQRKPTPTTTLKQAAPQSNADELKKYKDLLDSGIISQEEFNAKKKQLLGL